jgi:hypothetical protein
MEIGTGRLMVPSANTQAICSRFKLQMHIRADGNRFGAAEITGPARLARKSAPRFEIRPPYPVAPSRRRTPALPLSAALTGISTALTFSRPPVPG